MVNLKDKFGRSLYFSNRKEYYRRQNISKSLKVFRKTGVVKSLRKKKVYYTNFSIAESENSGIFYVVGSLSSMKYIPLEVAQTIIKTSCPKGYTPTNFYQAEEEGKQQYTTFTLFRDDEEFISEVLNV